RPVPEDGGGPTAESAGERLPRISVSLAGVGIEVVHRLGEPGGETAQSDGFSAHRLLEALQACPIDAISVGHYLGVHPQGAELLLDRSISRGLRERAAERIGVGAAADELEPDGEPLLVQYAERGLLRSELARP